MLVTRKLVGFDPPLVTLFYALFAGICRRRDLSHSAMGLADGSVVEWLLLLALGALGGLGHYLLIHRLSAGAGVVRLAVPLLPAPEHGALGYVVFGDTPDHWSLIGSAVVIASGLYLVHRERIAHRESLVGAMEQRGDLVMRAFVSAAQSSKRPFGDRLAHRCHQVLIEDGVDPRQDHGAEVLARLDQVMDVGARIIAARPGTSFARRGAPDRRRTWHCAC